MEDTSNTGAEQEKPHKKGTFVKGDARINRKGRPKSFDKLRELAQDLAREAATVTKDGVTRPVEINGHTATQIEMLLRTMMRENPARFVEIAFGKVPDQVDVNQSGRVIFEVVRHDGKVSDTSEDAAQ